MAASLNPPLNLPVTMQVAGNRRLLIRNAYINSSVTTVPFLPTGSWNSTPPVSTFIGTDVIWLDDATSHTGDIPSGPQKLRPGTYTFDDGAILTVEANGTWTLDDKNQKQRYRGNPERAFNRYVNASDIMEDFILFVRKQGIRGDQIFDLPIRLFIMFLILEAEKQDRVDHTATEQQLLADAQAHKRHRTQRCGFCGRFLSQAKVKKRMFFCSGEHLDRFDAKAFSPEAIAA